MISKYHECMSYTVRPPRCLQAPPSVQPLHVAVKHTLAFLFSLSLSLSLSLHPIFFSLPLSISRSPSLLVLTDAPMRASRLDGIKLHAECRSLLGDRDIYSLTSRLESRVKMDVAGDLFKTYPKSVSIPLSPRFTEEASLSISVLV